MKENFEYTYKFERGQFAVLDEPDDIPDTATIKVDKYWYSFLKEQDRIEYNDCHRENRRHVSYEKLEQLDDFLVPKQLYDDENNPFYALTDKEKREALWILYDKLLRGTGALTERQFQAFQYRLLCEMPFEQVAYSMKFDFPIDASIQLAKKHYYAAIKKLRKIYIEYYKAYKYSLNLWNNYIKIKVNNKPKKNLKNF